MLRTFSFTLFALAIASGCEPTDPQVRAAGIFERCAQCHGDDGHGMPSVEAPNIAGLPAWYVDAQLVKFRAGGRGAHFDDFAGLRMRPMALSIPKDEDVKIIAEYVSKLIPPPQHEAVLQNANLEHGKQLFATCQACHGADGGGNQALSAPPTAGHQDWYILAQLKKFKSGVRGNNPKDPTGATMRAMSLTLTDEQSMVDVASYIASLPRK